MRERGFVSLLTTIFISLLLVIIATSIISIETLQLRKSEDAEQSLRAYYAAESGVEDAAAKVLAGTAVGPGCNTDPSFDPGAEVWTCQQVTTTGSPQGTLQDADTAVTVDPGKVTPPYRSVIIEWQQSNDPTPAKFNVNLGSGFPCDPRNTGTCTVGGYDYAAPPMETTVVSYPNSNFRAGDARLTISNALITPKGGGASGVVPYGTFANHGPFNANCAPLSTQTLPGFYTQSGAPEPINYNCWAVITNLSPSNLYLFRIRTRYMPAQYEMIFKSALDGSGSIVDVPTGMAMIDVTAKAGTSFRRVISQLPLNTSAAAELNYVIYSDTNICKDFDVINNVPPTSGCPY